MRFTLTHNLRDAMGAVKDDMAVAVTRTADRIEAGLKGELRAQVTGSGLGARLANSWRGRRYPEQRNSLSAAAFVWSKAPHIIDAFDRGATILPLGGRRYLAIPTENVPPRRRGGGFGGRGAKMNPFEVETAFNQDLVFTRTAKGTLIAFIEAVAAKNKRGFRSPSLKRLRDGRPVDIVVMFILIPSAKLPRKLDIDAAAERWAGRADDILGEEIAA